MSQSLQLSPSDSPLHSAVEKVLERVRPHLKSDGGDVELVGCSLDGEVTLRLTGCVARCPMAQMALVAGLEGALKDSIAEVRSLRVVR